MTEVIERVALAILGARYPAAEIEAHWPDKLDSLVNGPPFDADGYREMARAAIEAMREPTAEMLAAVYPVLGIPPTPIYADAYRIMMDAALSSQQGRET